MAIFASLLLARGFRIVCMTPDPSVIQAILRARGAVFDQNLYIIALPELELQPSTWARCFKAYLKERLHHVRVKLSGLQRSSELMSKAATESTNYKPTLLEKWRFMAHRYANGSPLVQVTGDMPLSRRCKRHVFRIVFPPVWYTAQILLMPLRVLRKLRSPSTHTGILHPAALANAIQKALPRSPWRPDFMLLMYHDLLMTKPECWKGSASIIPIPWGGIRFMPSGVENVGKEGYFRHSQFRGMCFLDEHAVSAYSMADPNRFFAFLPDITTIDLPAQTPVFVQEIRSRAAGRKIVLMCGSIEGRKNVDIFCQLAKKADPRRWFFAVVGQVHPHTFSQQDQNAVKHFIEAQEGNTFYLDTFFPDERDMNAVIQSADILFAAYKNFRISSNMLVKAAYFEKPILVSDGYLMSDRVRRYGIGLAVDQDDARGMLGAIEQLMENQVSPECFAAYRGEFNKEALASSLEKFVMRAFE